VNDSFNPKAEYRQFASALAGCSPRQSAIMRLADRRAAGLPAVHVNDADGDRTFGQAWEWGADASSLAIHLFLRRADGDGSWRPSVGRRRTGPIS